MSSKATRISDFYPRSPCGERRVKSFMRNGFFLISIHALLAESDAGTKSHDPGKVLFLSTLSLRRATTAFLAARASSLDFYPRSPCGERRARCHHHRPHLGHFYPRSPCGERPTKPHQKQQAQHISIHALLAESDGF